MVRCPSWKTQIGDVASVIVLLNQTRFFNIIHSRILAFKNFNGRTVDFQCCVSFRAKEK